MYFDITKADYMIDYKIGLVFADGKSGQVDLNDYASGGGVFSVFSDMNYFKNFRIQYGVLIWGNGELDIAPETLYLRTTGLKSIQWDAEEPSQAV